MLAAILLATLVPPNNGEKVTMVNILAASLLPIGQLNV